jgi:DNA recombination protein RmuC
MPLELTSLLLGVLLGAVPCLVLAGLQYRRASERQAESALLDERLATALMAQEGLNAQLEASRE